MANVWIAQGLIDEILLEVERFFPLETGGAFFGYYSKKNDVVITHLIPAGPRAKHKKYSFEPDQSFQLEMMAELYFKHNAAIGYLGDWHSHPKHTANLSRRDEKTLLNIALSNTSKCPYPIMLIVGSLPKEWTVNCIRFVEGKHQIWPFYSCNYVPLKLKID
jgi:integrative and conjugative element protein (TIGR02256 family)